MSLLFWGLIIFMLVLADWTSRFPRFFRKIYKCPNCKSYMYTTVHKDHMEIYCGKCAYRTVKNIKER